MVGAGANTGTSIREEAGASCPLQNQRTETTVSFPPFSLTGGKVGTFSRLPSSPSVCPSPSHLGCFFQTSHLLLGPGLCQMKPERLRQQPGKGGVLPHPPTPCQLQPSPWQSLLCFPICLSPFLTSLPWPSSPSSPLLVPSLFCASLAGWLALKPRHTAGLLGQASAREGREGCLLTTTPSQPAADRLPGLHL